MDKDELGQPNLIITVKEARKLLGVEAKDLSDQQVMELIQNFSAIAKLYIQSVPKY